MTRNGKKAENQINNRVNRVFRKHRHQSAEDGKERKKEKNIERQGLMINCYQ